MRIENERRASCTLSVPTAESFRPVKGNTSGPRWHKLLRLTRHTKLTRVSIRGAKVLGSSPKRLICCPYLESAISLIISLLWVKDLIGTWGPNCSSE